MFEKLRSNFKLHRDDDEDPNPKKRKRGSMDATTPATPAKSPKSKKPKVDANSEFDEVSFCITYPPLNAENGEPGSILHTQAAKSPFTEKLDIIYKVEPQDEWNRLQGYKRFRVQEEVFELGDVILVKPGFNPYEKDNSDAGLGKWWVAHILEIKAENNDRVFLRVFWFPRPKDTPEGRQPYQGRNEVIASNEMDVIDVHTVERKITVKHWDENDDETPEVTDAFWRQTYNFHTKEYSNLSKICVCNEPFYPDNWGVQCENEKCKLWMHEACILEHVVEVAEKRANAGEDPFAADDLDGASPEKSDGSPVIEVRQAGQGKGGKGVKRKKGGQKANFKAHMDQISKPEEKKHFIRLTDNRPGQGRYSKHFPLKCLKCSAVIQK